MKWLCTKTNELSHRTGIGNMKLFVAIGMLICGFAGCLVAIVLYMLPVMTGVSLAKLVVICAGYGMFLVGMLGSSVYLLIKEPLSEV